MIHGDRLMCRRCCNRCPMMIDDVCLEWNMIVECTLSSPSTDVRDAEPSVEVKFKRNSPTMCKIDCRMYRSWHDKEMSSSHRDAVKLTIMSWFHRADDRCVDEMINMFLCCRCQDHVEIMPWCRWHDNHVLTSPMKRISLGVDELIIKMWCHWHH